jgi:hypothetical protein
MEKTGASAVINHQILQGKQHLYEDWLHEIEPLCRAADGNIDWQIIRPIPHLTDTYTVIIRFDTIDNLKSWIESDTRKQLIEKVKPILAKDDHYSIRSGLDFLFESVNTSAKPPVKWKQYVVTWSAIYPLSLLIPELLLPICRTLNLPDNRFLHSLLISGTVVFIMVYLLMPGYTRLIKKWLYK